MTGRVSSPPMHPSDVFARLESEVRVYSRSWPVVFGRARGSWLHAEDGSPYLDFFTGSGTMNYGHNNPKLKSALLAHLESDEIVHTLDMFTVARREFLESFARFILDPRDMDYRVAFPGPGGANAVEAALKLARKVTGRTNVLSFTRGFHGMTLGALAVTGNASKRRGAGVPLTHTTSIPFDGHAADDAGRHLERMLSDVGSGLDAPAAAIVETVQGEGGMNAASIHWLQRLAAVCREHDVLLIVDDIQMGCGRTGGFFSFEQAGLKPDMVCLSKAISGYGLPMSLLLLRPNLDVWAPAEHSGTFRGTGSAFVTATAALRHYWRDEALSERVVLLGDRVGRRLDDMRTARPDVVSRTKGRGLARGIEFTEPRWARAACVASFRRGLLLETAGAREEVIRLLPALTIADNELDEGLDTLADVVRRL